MDTELLHLSCELAAICMHATVSCDALAESLMSTRQHAWREGEALQFQAGTTMQAGFRWEQLGDGQTYTATLIN